MSRNKIRKKEIIAYEEELSKGPFTDEIKTTPFEESFSDEEWKFFLDLIQKRSDAMTEPVDEDKLLVG
ncbi:hypothetical protein [Lactobacillus paragasseri]|uniref:Uncharacterized protein n=1 Tax=Lactobacillus paragasseri TaxID=2107999 RepID=A0ABD4ZZ85_9LACO|nr:hypothetical protein [Lactobacillus paragasseri]MDK7952160.1 hypothetical protein [Lactobacillus paragasseri]MDO6360814.1 hypothetical protein [Lactobacillus paragasseri]